MSSSKKKTTTQKANVGHAAHTQDAASRGLAGQFQRPIKVTFIGAGSFFTPQHSA